MSEEELKIILKTIDPAIMEAHGWVRKEAGSSVAKLQLEAAILSGNFARIREAAGLSPPTSDDDAVDVLAGLEAEKKGRKSELAEYLGLTRDEVKAIAKRPGMIFVAEEAKGVAPAAMEAIAEAMIGTPAVHHIYAPMDSETVARIDNFTTSEQRSQVALGSTVTSVYSGATFFAIDPMAAEPITPLHRRLPGNKSLCGVMQDMWVFFAGEGCLVTCPECVSLMDMGFSMGSSDQAAVVDSVCGVHWHAGNGKTLCGDEPSRVSTGRITVTCPKCLAIKPMYAQVENDTSLSSSDQTADYRKVADWPPCIVIVQE